MLARLFVLFGGLIVLAFSLALVGPYFIDWTSYRSDFEREASRILGRTVTVHGDATARLLPFPSVTFSDIEVEGDEPGIPALTAETFSMDAELAPFLRGEILIFDMRIVRPRAVVDIAENGTINWTIRPDVPVQPGQIQLEKISLVDGEVLVWHGAGGREHLVADLDASISAKTLAGPWRVDSTFTFDGAPMRLAASTGALSGDGSMRLRLNLRPETVPVSMESDGTAMLSEGAITYAGNFRIENVSEADLIAEEEDDAFSIVIEEAGEEPALSYRASGRFTLDHTLLAIDEFRLESGPPEDPYVADGSASLSLGHEPHFSIRAEGQQLFLDARQDSRPATGRLPPGRRLAALFSAIGTLPQPRIPGTVDFSLPAIVAGDTTIRELELSAVPDTHGWRINELSAQLPGRATLEANGLLGTGDAAGFRGSLLLAIGQPSGFAAWVASDVDEAIRRLPAAGFSAEVDLSQRRQTFRNLELMLGNAKFSGEIDHHVPDDSRPSMLLRLSGGELDLDGVLAFASVFVDDSGATRFSEHDLDLAIEAGPVSVGGLTASRVDTALRLKDGQLDIDRLSVMDVSGATLSATGRIRGIPERPSGNLDASVVSLDLAPLARLVAERHPDNGIARRIVERLAIDPGLLAEANIGLVATAATNDDGTIGLAVSAKGEIGGGEFTAAGSATRKDGDFAGPVALSVSLRNDDAADIFTAYGLPGLSLGLVGGAETNVTLRGDPNGILRIEAGLHGDGLRSSFSGTAQGLDGQPVIEGRAEVAATDIEPWLATAGTGAGGAGWGVPVDLAADLRFDGEGLRASALSGTVSRHRVAAELSVTFPGGRPALSGKLSTAALDLAPLVEGLLGTDAMPQAGEGWKGKPFAAENTIPVTGEIDVETESLITGFGPSLRDARFRLSLANGGAAFSDFEAKTDQGALGGLFEFRNSGGTGLMSAQFALRGGRLESSGPDIAVSAVADVSANLTASGKTISGLLSSLSGSGSATLAELAIRGLDPGAFGEIIDVADAFGRDISEERVGGFAIGPLRGGSFLAEGAQLAFVVAGGVARTPTVMIRHPDASLEVALQVDLASGEVDGDGELAFEAGREALVGAEPGVRFALAGSVDAPILELDTGPLARYLTQRALEIEQYRVEAMQARLLERQRLRREARYYASLAGIRESSGPSGNEAGPEDVEDGNASGSGAGPEPISDGILPESTEVIPAEREESAAAGASAPEVRRERSPPAVGARQPDRPIELRTERATGASGRTVVPEPQEEDRSLLRRLFDRLKPGG